MMDLIAVSIVQDRLLSKLPFTTKTILKLKILTRNYFQLHKNKNSLQHPNIIRYYFNSKMYAILI